MKTPCRLGRALAITLTALLIDLPSVTLATQASPPDNNGTSIRLQTYQFDPLVAEPDVPAPLKAAGPPAEGWQLIQLKGPPNRAALRLLKKELGLSLARPLSGNAYLVHLTAEQSRQLEERGLLRWRGPYHPAFKLSPMLGQHRFVTPERQAVAGLVVLLQLFPDADLEQIANEVQALGMTVEARMDDTGIGGTKRLRVRAGESAQLEGAARLDGVEWIEEAPELTEDNDTTSEMVQSGTRGLASLYDHGLHGEGQILGIIDGPLDMNHCFFDDGGDAPGPAHRKVVGYHDDNPFTFLGPTRCDQDEILSGGILVPTATGHGTHTAGTLAGESPNLTDDGVARASRITYGRMSDLSWAGGGHSFREYLTLAHADGALIHSNSWSNKSTTAYDLTSQDLDAFSWDHAADLVVTSSSNNIDTDGDNLSDAPSPEHPPWNAKNGLVVAASRQEPDEMDVATGGVGPTGDLRRKPEIYAPGRGIQSAYAGTNCNLSACGGSSMSTPAVAGAAALARQYYVEGWYPTGTRQPHNAFTPSGALLKATLLNATRDMTGTDAFGVAAPLNGYPTDLEGWGQLVLDDALYFAGEDIGLSVWDVAHSAGLATGEHREFRLPVASDDERLKVTLVWMDPPPSAANFAAPVVNNLDLLVTAPDGISLYRGNHFVGGQSATGGSSDTLNNVEQVLIPTPDEGVWTLRVEGTMVSQGSPGQGYALVATADLPEPPASSGTQNTLLVILRFPDEELKDIEPSPVNLQTQMNEVVRYFDEVTYGQATIDYRVHPDILDLGRDHGDYFPPLANPLIELTEEVLAALGPGLLDPDPAVAGDEIDRLLLVTNDPGFAEDWSTTGPWPYDLPEGMRRRISVSVLGFQSPLSHFTHALGHQLGMKDLYLYADEGVHFTRPRADGWDNMAKPFANQHFLVWNKEAASWVTDQGSSVPFVARPAPGDTHAEIIHLHTQESPTAATKGLRIGLTNGVTEAALEQSYFLVEARDDSPGSFDENLPGAGVLVYRVNDAIPQGEGPVLLMDADPGTVGLEDAAYDTETSNRFVDLDSGVEIEVEPGTAGADYDIHLDYSAPRDDFDVYIRAGDLNPDGNWVPYLSADIWVDNPSNGFDEDGFNPPDPSNRDQPIEGVTNRLYFRVHNSGPADVHQLAVRASISEPYHTVGNEADFNRFIDERTHGLLEDGDNWIGFVEWDPEEDGIPHSCALVEITELGNDSNPYNNSAQENLAELPSSAASPYPEVVYPFTFRNPHADPGLFYFRTDGVPDGWDFELTPRKALLAGNERIAARLTVHPPESAAVCTDRVLAVSSWEAEGDTLVRVGGAVLSVQLRERTLLEATAGALPCAEVGLMTMQGGPAIFDKRAHPVAQTTTGDAKQCIALSAKGCTDPPRPYEQILVRYEDPAGNPVYRHVLTDENGCFADHYVVAEGGDWQVQAQYRGSDCSGPGEGVVAQVQVPLPRDQDQDDDGRKDSDEPIDDRDGDGNTGPTDRDSDNDGIIDGQEPDGDIDNDGWDNVNDPDSDGDGTPDGVDPTPWGDAAAAVKPTKPACLALCTPERWFLLALLALGVLTLVLVFYLGRRCCPRE